MWIVFGDILFQNTGREGRFTGNDVDFRYILFLKPGCDEEVSYAETMILHAFMKGLYDTETKEELLSKSPELSLDGSVTFVEARESGKRSAGVLENSEMSSSQVNKVTAYQKEKKESLLLSDKNLIKKCTYCN